MAILVINSKDKGFLNSLLMLVSKYKGAKAQLLDNDIISINEAEELTNEMLSDIESGEHYSIDEAQAQTNEFIKEWKNSL